MRYCIICEKIECDSHSKFISEISKRILPKLLDKNELVESIKFLFSQKTCSICNHRQVIDFTGNLTREAIVEHNHEVEDKGSIRGLVCKSCNVIEGKYRKSILEGLPRSQLILKFGILFIEKMDEYYRKGGGVTIMDSDYLPESPELMDYSYF